MAPPPPRASEPHGVKPIVERYPGAAALVDRGGRVLMANPTAAPLLIALAADGGRLLAMIDEALRHGAGGVDTVSLPGESGETMIEVTAIPIADSVLLLTRDLSLELNLRAALVESRRRYKDLVEISSDFAWETDALGVFLFVSPRGALGWTADQLVGRPAARFLVDTGGGESGGPSPFTAEAAVDQVEIWFRRADGVAACVAVSAVPMFDARGVMTGVRGVCRDVSEARERDAALAEARNRERLLAHIVRAMRDQVEPDAMLAGAAAAIARALGAQGCWIDRPVEAGGWRAAAAFGAAGVDVQDQSLPSPSAGRLLEATTSYRGAENGRLRLWREATRADWSEAERALFADVADQIGIALAQIGHQEALARLASTDALTGLMNRRAFVAALEQRIAGRSGGRCGALLYMDLNNFKLINDRCGHQRGDEALKAFAALLAERSRAGDLVARLGGDEFALWLQDSDSAGASDKAKAVLQLKDRLSEFAVEPDRPLAPSIGIAVYFPGQPEGVDALVARGDAAMYCAKKARSGFAFAPPPDAPPEEERTTS